MKITVKMINPDGIPSEAPSVIEINEISIISMSAEAVENFIRGIAWGHGTHQGWEVAGISYYERTQVMGYEVEAVASFRENAELKRVLGL